jgi:hypothetical protein
LPLPHSVKRFALINREEEGNKKKESEKAWRESRRIRVVRKQGGAEKRDGSGKQVYEEFWVSAKPNCEVILGKCNVLLAISAGSS